MIQQKMMKKEGILNYNAGQAMAKDMDDLNIMGDTASQDFNQILTNGSRQIADYAAFLNKELKRTGDYNAYSEKMAKLKAEVTNMKGLKTNVNAFLDAYEQAEISFPWEQGDVMVVDNVLYAHARNSYEGERIGQGAKNAAAYILDNGLLDEIELRTLQKVGIQGGA